MVEWNDCIIISLLDNYLICYQQILFNKDNDDDIALFKAYIDGFSSN